MPYDQFTLPRGGATLVHKAEVAAAVTRMHAEVTGAPAADGVVLPEITEDAGAVY
ncbi:tautomerase family protein [Pseudonocardia sp. KRD-184]|uniref:Tautomerase family protein n=1 Tax=Pseudonocardia oceani TaxID=2792013 RepID=A0ABS6U904_9PSEU|nr:tautomerase family protein [Pseudonocardia oceani]MBW0088664.1 tautomerase family protein [Pseudonocardia oceani]MBW0095516.1 tautomerase family protein [Pseudonocardia oceani]MBW0108503.1 tautomerase family protein [Pseudonocardia oceani]MBW0121527.1 tautomerase family protein [Pseudonocardia oceani]MBW0128708.1 tautomerase family protein [Pseudonocardia oceani]